MEYTFHHDILKIKSHYDTNDKTHESVADNMLVTTDPGCGTWTARPKSATMAESRPSECCFTRMFYIATTQFGLQHEHESVCKTLQQYTVVKYRQYFSAVVIELIRRRVKVNCAIHSSKLEKHSTEVYNSRQPLNCLTLTLKQSAHVEQK